MFFMCKPGIHLFWPIKPFVNVNTNPYKKILAIVFDKEKRLERKMIRYDNISRYE